MGKSHSRPIPEPMENFKMVRKIIPPFNLTLVPTYVYTYTGGTNDGTVTIGGIVYDKITAATRTRNVQLDVLISPSIASTITYTSYTPSVTVTTDGYIQGTGGTTIRCNIDDLVMHYNFVAEVLSSQEQLIFNSFAPGVLAGAIWQNTEDLISGSSKNLYSVRDHENKVYTRNPNFWLGPSIDFSCWPVWNSRYGNRFNGCLITPRHLIMARHAAPKSGDTIRFVSSTGVVAEREIIGSLNADDLLGAIPSSDLLFVELDSAVPAGINPCKVLPDNISTKMTKIGLPLIVGKQDYTIGTRETPETSNETSGEITHFPNDISDLASYSVDIVPGDSGSPAWVIIDDQLVLVGTHYTSHRASYLPSSAPYLNAVLSAISGSTETTTPVDVSSYPNI